MMNAISVLLTAGALVKWNRGFDVMFLHLGIRLWLSYWNIALCLFVFSRLLIEHMQMQSSTFLTKNDGQWTSLVLKSCFIFSLYCPLYQNQTKPWPRNQGTHDSVTSGCFYWQKHVPQRRISHQLLSKSGRCYQRNLTFTSLMCICSGPIRQLNIYGRLNTDAAQSDSIQVAQNIPNLARQSCSTLDVHILPHTLYTYTPMHQAYIQSTEL